MAKTGLNSSSSVTYELQRNISGLGGTGRFERDMGKSYVEPEDADGNGSPDAWHNVFPQAAAVAPNNPVVRCEGKWFATDYGLSMGSPKALSHR